MLAVLKVVTPEGEYLKHLCANCTKDPFISYCQTFFCSACGLSWFVYTERSENYDWMEALEVLTPPGSCSVEEGVHVLCFKAVLGLL